MKTASEVLKTIKDKDVKYVDFRFTDPRGKWQHVTFDIGMIDEDVFAGRGMEQGVQLFGVDFNRAGADGLVPGLAVEHAGNAARLAHTLKGGASDAGTLGYLERNGLGHKTG